MQKATSAKRNSSRQVEVYLPYGPGRKVALLQTAVGWDMPPGNQPEKFAAVQHSSAVIKFDATRTGDPPKSARPHQRREAIATRPRSHIQKLILPEEVRRYSPMQSSSTTTRASCSTMAFGLSSDRTPRYKRHRHTHLWRHGGYLYKSVSAWFSPIYWKLRPPQSLYREQSP